MTLPTPGGTYLLLSNGDILTIIQLRRQLLCLKCHTEISLGIFMRQVVFILLYHIFCTHTTTSTRVSQLWLLSYLSCYVPAINTRLCLYNLALAGSCICTGSCFFFLPVPVLPLHSLFMVLSLDGPPFEVMCILTPLVITFPLIFVLLSCTYLLYH